jgi:hypothetical protein
MSNENGSLLHNEARAKMPAPVIYGTPITRTESFNALFLVLDDLLKRIADTEDPTIRRMRAQVRSELVVMRGNANRENAPHNADHGWDQHGWGGSPWGHQALAALAGAAVALSVFRRI